MQGADGFLSLWQSWDSNSDLPDASWWGDKLSPTSNNWRNSQTGVKMSWPHRTESVLLPGASVQYKSSHETQLLLDLSPNVLLPQSPPVRVPHIFSSGLGFCLYLFVGAQGSNLASCSKSLEDSDREGLHVATPGSLMRRCLPAELVRTQTGHRDTVRNRNMLAGEGLVWKGGGGLNPLCCSQWSGRESGRFTRGQKGPPLGTQYKYD